MSCSEHENSYNYAATASLGDGVVCPLSFLLDQQHVWPEYSFEFKILYFRIGDWDGRGKGDQGWLVATGPKPLLAASPALTSQYSIGCGTSILA